MKSNGFFGLFRGFNNIFLWALVRSDTVLRQAKSKNKGATVGRVNVKDIKNFKVFLPPKPLQDKFATIVQQVEATKAHYQDSLDELNELFGSLSQRAFKGELDLNKMEVDNDSTTSSSALLDELMVAEPSVGYGQVNAVDKS